MKPLLLGMNNPYSDDPKYDLFPYPENSAGYRLYALLGDDVRRGEYLAAFDRLNLLHAREWSAKAARKAAAQLLPSLNGRFVVVLGREVRCALGLDPAEPLALRRYCPASGPVFSWLAFPHPSGRNRWWNEPGNRDRAAAVLRTVFDGDLPGM